MSWGRVYAQHQPDPLFLGVLDLRSPECERLCAGSRSPSWTILLSEAIASAALPVVAAPTAAVRAVRGAGAAHGGRLAQHAVEVHSVRPERVAAPRVDPGAAPGAEAVHHGPISACRPAPGRRT